MLCRLLKVTKVAAFFHQIYNTSFHNVGFNICEKSLYRTVALLFSSLKVNFYIPDHSVAKESCLVFLTNVIDNSSKSMFTKMEIKYFAFGAKYRFDNKIRECYKTSLQKVESLLICDIKLLLNILVCTVD